MRRFRVLPSVVSLAFGVPSRNASMPPLCSTVRMARVDRRMRTGWPRMSDSIEVTCRLGRKRGRGRGDLQRADILAHHVLDGLVHDGAGVAEMGAGIVTHASAPSNDFSGL